MNENSETSEGFKICGGRMRLRCARGLDDGELPLPPLAASLM